MRRGHVPGGGGRRGKVLRRLGPRDVERLAYGVCGLTPAELGQMTGSEFWTLARYRIEDRLGQERSALRRTALHAAVVAFTDDKKDLHRILFGCWTGLDFDTDEPWELPEELKKPTQGDLMYEMMRRGTQ